MFYLYTQSYSIHQKLFIFIENKKIFKILTNQNFTLTLLRGAIIFDILCRGDSELYYTFKIFQYLGNTDLPFHLSQRISEILEENEKMFK